MGGVRLWLLTIALALIANAAPARAARIITWVTASKYVSPNDLVAALKWGFFRPVPESPRTWKYTTVDQHAQAWSLRLDFVRPPHAVERFARKGRGFSGSGSGRLAITTPAGCRLRVKSRSP